MDEPENIFNLTATGWTAIGSVVSAASVIVLSVFNALFLRSALKQSKIMKDTATDVHQQADWMKTQAEQMTAQTIKLGESIAVAQQGASAALSQIKMMKDREGARISVSINDDAVDVSPKVAEAIGIALSNDGPSVASDVRVVAELFGQPGEGVPFMGNATPLTATNCHPCQRWTDQSLRAIRQFAPWSNPSWTTYYRLLLSLERRS